MEELDIFWLQSLIENQIEENLSLDYKAANSLGKSAGKKKELSKDVSAFANSNGGRIIYGVKEFDQEERRHLPEKIDGIKRTDFSKEWLEQVVNSNVSPRIQGVLITPISITEDEVAYVMDIPKSTTAHQASDLKYYKRYNFESIAMQDYEIRDVMNRSSTPSINLTFEIDRKTFQLEPFFKPITIPAYGVKPAPPEERTTNELKIYARNNGSVYASYVNCYVHIPVEALSEEEYDHIDPFGYDGVPHKRLYRDNTIREIKEVIPSIGKPLYKYWPSRYEPILPGAQLRMDTIELCDGMEIPDVKIVVDIHADNAPKSTIVVDLRDVSIKVIELNEGEEDD